MDDDAADNDATDDDATDDDDDDLPLRHKFEVLFLQNSIPRIYVMACLK